MKTAVYAGSFDPVTRGHLWMISQGSMLFDKLVIAIGTNSQKKNSFPLNERIQMLETSTKHFPNVAVTHFDNQFLVNYATLIGANFILRGIRCEGDYEYERVMRYVNEDLNSNISTVFFMPPRPIAEVSSGLVRQLVGPDGWEKVVVNFVPPCVYNKLLIKHKGLFFRWHNLAKRCGLQDTQSKYEDLYRSYSESHRAYHNLAHIANVLLEFDSIRHEIMNPDSVEIALWYHDVVYDTQRKDNEEESANRLLSAFGNQDKTELVRLIMATKHNVEMPETTDEKYIADIDLAKLGSSIDEFSENNTAIRQEFNWASEDEYRKGRRAFFHSMLDKSHIFYTAHFRNKYEELARDNLKRAIQELG
jgi:pantetheine-phosphate adenylyltransferase